jgi:pilus assembly protein CpaF
MLQAMSTGHDGSIATIHSNSSRECLGRMEMMMLLSGFSIPQRAMRQQIASAINIIVHVARLSDGSRRMMTISEVTGMEGDAIMMQDLFEFALTATDATGKVHGNYRSTGIRSAYAQRIERAGYKLETSLRPTGTN